MNQQIIQSDRNNLRSQSLDLLRFPLAVVVLTIHVFSTNGIILHGHLFETSDYPFFVEVNHFIDGFLRGQSVPIYFFISGFVFFFGVKLTKEKYVQKIRNRIRSLLIPYFIWNTIAILFLVVRLLPVFKSFLTYSDPSWEATLSDFLSCFGAYNYELTPAPDLEMERVATGFFPVDAPLWFLRDLMIVSLCAPLLYWLIKRARIYVVLLLGILWFSFSCCGVGYINQLLTAFFFFTWGAYMSINQKDMLVEFGKFFKISAVLYPCFGLLYVAAVHYCFDALVIIKSLNVFVGLIFAFNVSAWLLQHNICKVSPFLASSGFFIFVCHALVCYRFTKVVFVLLKPSSDISVLMVYVLSVITTLVFLLLTFYLLRRYMSSFLKVLIGGK